MGKHRRHGERGAAHIGLLVKVEYKGDVKSGNCEQQWEQEPFNTVVQGGSRFQLTVTDQYKVMLTNTSCTPITNLYIQML